MSVLDTIDTTVTMEWAETRTVATLVRLGDRMATVSALRTPDTGDACYLKLEGDGPDDTIAMDGVCQGKRDGEWGEFEVDIAIIRVGTTVSATALRDFIEHHAIAKGGTVAVGKNRDNPDVKRFVYTLPQGSAVAGPSSRVSSPRPGTPTTGSNPVVVSSGRDAAFLRDTVQTSPVSASPSAGDSTEPNAPVSSFAPRLPTATHEPVRLTAAATNAPLGIEEVDPELREMLDMLDRRAGGVSDEGPAIRLTSSDMEQVAQVASSSPSSITSSGYEEDAPILVETVEQGDNQPRPVLTVPEGKPSAKRGLVARLFGRGDRTEVNPAPAQPTATQAAAPQPVDPLAVWDAPPRQPQSGRGAVSGSLAAVQQLFSVDHAVRTEKPVTFESGKKKRQGVALRLSESKIRVRAPVMPALYERISVQLPAPRGAKEPVVLRCEVTRLRAADTEGGEQSFDAKVTGSNDPTTMARLRQLMGEMQPASGDGF